MATTLYDEGDGVRLETTGSPNRLSVFFGSVKEIAQWASDEAKLWSELGMAAAQDASQLGFPVQGRFFDREVASFNIVFQKAQADENMTRGITQEVKDQLQALGQQIDDGSILASGTRTGAGVIDLKRTDHEAFLVAALLGSPKDLPNQRLRTMGGGNGLDIRALIKAGVVRFQPDFEQFDTSAIALRQQVDAWKAEFRELQNQGAALQEAMTKVDGLENTYLKKLQYDAPVSYWSARANTLLNVTIGTFLLFFGCIAGYSMVAWYLFLPKIEALHAATDIDTKLVVLDVAVVTLPSLAFFWFLRLVARIFIQSLTRGADARERATLVQTFLAFCQEARTAPTETERLVLARSISRPGPGDAIEEVAPDTILDQLISAIRPK